MFVFNANKLNKMKRLKRQTNLQPSPEQSIKKMREDSFNMLRSEITKIFQTAKEDAINTVENIFENAKMKAEASIQKLVGQSFSVNCGHAGHFEISSEVNKMSLGDMSSCFPPAKNKEDTIDKMINEESDIKLDNIEDDTERKIMNNLQRFELYISDCVKVTDLIIYFNLFSIMEREELISIYKEDRKKATKRALEMIKKMDNRPGKYRKLVDAIKDAGYPKVVKILDGTLIPVGSCQRDIIKQCTEHIFHLLNTSEILPHLYSKGVISNEDKQQILQTERTESTCIAVIELLHMLPNRHKRWFKYFNQSLKESGHDELAEIIKDITYKVQNSDMEGTSSLDKEDPQKEKVNPVIKEPRRSLSRRKPKELLPSDFQNAIENKSACVNQTHELRDIDKEPDKQIPSPISVSSDDHSCIQASRLDHGFDFSDSSFPD